MARKIRSGKHNPAGNISQAARSTVFGRALALEPRMLFDAAAGPTAAQTLTDAHADRHLDRVIHGTENQPDSGLLDALSRLATDRQPAAADVRAPSVEVADASPR
ncbi:MAG TPA: LEPR-XLL domain-containing protein, partial [Azospirillaceae bacterium]|nr:LEPR-XLL domain-containing protein [Azospirillaceae bacterium]